MRKKSVRLASAALAVCMMASVLPLGAMAQGGEETENGVSALDVSSDPDTDKWKIEHGWVKIDETNFPDAGFRNFLSTGKSGTYQDGDLIDQNQDGWLSRDEIAAAQWMNISWNNRQIGNLKGIEHFKELEWLNCTYAELTGLDVSKNTALKYLYCSSNKLTELNVSNNTALEHLDCMDNQLTKLQLTKPDAVNNTALTVLNCQGNQLTELDVSKNKALTELYCSINQLRKLNVSENKVLESLHCDFNQLTELDVSQNTELEILQCAENQLTSLDLKNTNLENADSDQTGTVILYADGNSYNIEVGEDRTYVLSGLPKGFNLSKVKEGSWIGGTVSGGILTVDEGVDKVTYTYDCGITQRGKHCLVMFTLNVNPVDIPEDGGDTDAAADNIKGALSAIVVGAVAGAIIYETGTGIYRVINMPGIAMPSNRGELAMLLWEHAGKPEPVSTALYSDITEDNIDLNKAARWAVEQDLMQDNSEKNTFNPRFPVSKLRTCLTWNAAKEKGLFDTDKTAE